MTFKEWWKENGKLYDYDYTSTKHIWNAALQSQWISVEDELPEYDKNRLYGSISKPILICKGNWVGEGYYRKGEFYYCGMPEIGITHWQPLPQPPKGE